MEDTRMERVWAPWRMAYLEMSQPEGCLFCNKPKETDDAAALILHRGEHAFIMLNAFPYNNGHLMIAPYRHTADMESLSTEESREIMELCQFCLSLLRQAYRPDGYNVGMNLGRTAGAGIADHLHLHVVPRWNGDTNFMPVIGETKVLSEALQNTYARLHGAMTDNPR
jgi:ATP adenylyltransferase